MNDRYMVRVVRLHALSSLFTPPYMIKSMCVLFLTDQVRLLASGLASEANNLSIQVLNCSTPAARYFVKEVLGVPAVPSFCIFPKQSRTFYKYRQGRMMELDVLLCFLLLPLPRNLSKSMQGK